VDQTRLQALSRTRKWAHQTLVDKKSKVYQAFLTMENAAYADGALPGRGIRGRRTAGQDQGTYRGGYFRANRLRVLHAVAHRTSGPGRRNIRRGSGGGRRGSGGGRGRYRNGRWSRHGFGAIRAASHGVSFRGSDLKKLQYPADPVVSIPTQKAGLRRLFNALSSGKRGPRGPRFQPRLGDYLPDFGSLFDTLSELLALRFKFRRQFLAKFLEETLDFLNFASRLGAVDI